MLSEKDEELLSILRCNGRASISDIARVLNLSRTTVQNRIAKLEQNQVIKSYSVELGSGYENQLVSAHVSLKVKPKLRSSVSTALRKIHQISQHYSISGEYDLLAIVQAQTLEQLSRVLDNMCSLEGVERTNTSLILETLFKR